MIGDAFLPLLGQPSLTRSEIISLYVKYGITDYTESDIASDLENANKYSAVGIEGQIAKRATNVPGSGYAPVPTITVVRAVPPPVDSTVVGNVVATGPSGNATVPVGPTGPIIAVQGPGLQSVTAATVAPAATSTPTGTIFGFSPITLALVAAVAGAAWYLVRRR